VSQRYAEDETPTTPTGKAGANARAKLTLAQWRALLDAFDALGTAEERERLCALVVRWCALDADGRVLACALVARL
jgi:hypothetical protein